MHEILHCIFLILAPPLRSLIFFVKGPFKVANFCEGSILRLLIFVIGPFSVPVFSWMHICICILNCKLSFYTRIFTTSVIKWLCIWMLNFSFHFGNKYEMERSWKRNHERIITRRLSDSLFILGHFSFLV